MDFKNDLEVKKLKMDIKFVVISKCRGISIEDISES